jgi:hypothetical protein
LWWQKRRVAKEKHRRDCVIVIASIPWRRNKEEKSSNNEKKWALDTHAETTARNQNVDDVDDDCSHGADTFIACASLLRGCVRRVDELFLFF